MSTRRSFLGFLAVAPVAAKAAIEMPLAAICDPEIAVSVSYDGGMTWSAAEIAQMQARINLHRSIAFNYINTKTRFVPYVGDET